MKNIISKNTTLIGKFNGYIKSIEIEGNLIIKDQNQTKIENLIVGHDGLVELKSLVAEYVYIDGFFKGNIEARKRIILEKNCHLIGDIKTPEVITREGAIFYGNLFLTKKDFNTEIIQKKLNSKINKVKQESIFKKINHN